MMPYREQIEQAVAEQAVDLLAYYDGPDEVREHLVSIIPSVAVQDGKLCGCTAITYRQDLSEHQWNALFRDIAGQYSDGWGEGFEQRDIEVDGGILNVHFWQSDRFEMVPIAVSSAEQTVPERPRMELAGHDGNIFAILGRAANVPFPVSWTVKMKKKQKETQDILSYHTQAAGCSDKARAKASGGRQPIEECGRTGL